ncbi:serine hydrolase [Dactylosporangium sp. AC04546]|uniref:serine hydrolase n=1 Tax=Dactylosporangium sp. AC04546 TaxID=2862460 RepID=UPI001EE13AEE|nr:serine hydrolase [Dactylosporangium sp. AC04546]WVK80857.1 serine hydrolase [Dactylosporangium sp. AC04546]
MRLSYWIGPPGGSAGSARHPDAAYSAASTMKVAVLAALYRADVDLDAPLPVVNDFPSALDDGSRYANDPGYDDEDQVWTHLGGAVPARWLARRMIVRSSNLATNLLLARVGLPAVAEVWRLAGATNSVTARGIEDHAARDAGLDNVVTAADLAALFGALHLGRLGSPSATSEMLDLLAAQEWRQDLAAGLPEGVRVAHKNGWITGIRHSAGIVYPPDADPYVIAVCTRSDAVPPPDDYDERACSAIARLSAERYGMRHQ